MELDEEGRFSRLEYKVTLSEKYKELYSKASDKRGDARWHIHAGRGREFPNLVVNNMPYINLKKATTLDISNLIQYFTYCGKNIEDILKNIKFKRI